MGTGFAIVSLLIVAGFIALFFLLRRRVPGENQALLLLQQQIQELTRVLDTKIIESTKLMQSQASELSRSMQAIIRDITERLTRVDEGQKQVVSFADQLKQLQDILQNPKRRGILGEYYLEEILKNVLPPNAFSLQYEFRDGATVDAVIRTPYGLIPLDAKFSLENYNRLLEAGSESERQAHQRAFVADLKNRIEETARYIRPVENTTDYAIMFIPSEAIYYDLLVNRIGAVKENTVELLQYAIQSKHVFIVSPTSFYAYLQAILQGFRGMQIQESAKGILQRVGELRRHIENYDTHMRRLGTQLGTAVNTYNTAYKELGKVDKDVFKITGKAAEIEPLAIARPAAEEESEH